MKAETRLIIIYNIGKYTVYTKLIIIQYVYEDQIMYMTILHSVYLHA